MKSPPVCTPLGLRPNRSTKGDHILRGIRKIPDGQRIIKIITPGQFSSSMRISWKVTDFGKIIELQGAHSMLSRAYWMFLKLFLTNMMFPELNALVVDCKMFQTRIMLSRAYWFNSFPFFAASWTLNMNHVQGTQ